MLFNTYEFPLFLAATVLMRWLAPERARIWILLVASFLFYASWGPVYCLLLGGLGVTSYVTALAIERWRSRGRVVLVLAIVVLLGVLGYYKYTGFVLEQLHALGALSRSRIGSIVLPLGISFYTFTAVGYLIDVHRGEPAEKNLAVHLVFIAFFPHLVAGPIVRKREISEQLRSLGKALDADRFSMGVLLILIGLFKKMVIADGLSVHADLVFAHPERYSSGGVALGILAYSGQILCDFSGYTDVGIGAAKVLGIDFPENFNLPYLASSPADFWRRWHMTLSRWLRDYLYVVVGGRGRSAVHRYTAPIITMTLGGLWHGASWNFVIWGLFHGVLLALHQGWVRITRTIPGFDPAVRGSVPYRIVAIGVTFVLVAAGWVFFRASTPDRAFAMLARLVEGARGGLGSHAKEAGYLLIGLAVAHLFAPRDWATRAYVRAPGLARGVLWFGIVAGVYLLAAPPAEFIYFMF